MDVFNKKRIAELEAEIDDIQSVVNKFYEIPMPEKPSASAWVALQSYSLYSRRRKFSDLADDAVNLKAELASKNKEIEMLKDQLQRMDKVFANMEQEAEQLEQAKIAEKQLAEMRKMVKVGQTFKKLNNEYIVTGFRAGRAGAYVDCDSSAGLFDLDEGKFYYKDLDLLKALVKKK